MSIQAVAWVLDHSSSRGTDRLVLISYANHANKETGLAYPGQRQVAREAGLGVGTIAESLRRLCGLGELECVEPGGPRTSGLYRLTFMSGDRSVRDLSAEFVARAQRSDDERSGAERSARPRGERSARPRAGQNHQEPRDSALTSRATRELSAQEASTYEPSGENTAAALAALTDAVGHRPETKSAKKNWAAAARELVEIGATPADIAARARGYRDRFTFPLTPAALVKHWSELGASSTDPALRVVVECDTCSGDGWLIGEPGEPSTRCPSCNPPKEAAL